MYDFLVIIVLYVYVCFSFFYFMYFIVIDVVFFDMFVVGCSKGGFENIVWCVRGCYYFRIYRYGFFSN